MKLTLKWLFFIYFSGQVWKQYVSFLFSLKNKDNVPPFKSPVEDHQHAILSSPYQGASFGGGPDFYISDNSNANQLSYSNFGDTYQPPAGYVFGTRQTQSLLAESFYFTPTEVEVFF